MKTRATFFLLSFTIAGFILFAGTCSAQQKSDDQAKGGKTITIHVIKEMDGKTIVVDTTVVTDGDFDTDAFLEKKGVGIDMAKNAENVDKRIVIIHPDSKEFPRGESDKNSPDTVGNMDKQVFIFKNDYDLIAPPGPRGGMPFHYKLQVPGDYMPMQHPPFEDMMQGMLRTLGLENVMPFGEMKQVVVKKKRNGKKVIITFEDRKGESFENGKGNKKEEKVIIYKNDNQGMAPQNTERIFIDGETGEKIIIQKEVRKTENGNEIIVNTSVDKAAPVKVEKKVIIITEEEKK
jgi:hypothetical protein